MEQASVEFIFKRLFFCLFVLWWFTIVSGRCVLAEFQFVLPLLTLLFKLCKCMHKTNIA